MGAEESPHDFKSLNVILITPNLGAWNHRNLRTGQYWHLTLGFQEHQGLCGKLNNGLNSDIHILTPEPMNILFYMTKGTLQVLLS